MPEVVAEVDVFAQLLLNGELPLAPAFEFVPVLEDEPEISEAEEPATTYA